jgi:hypothetical protein
VNKVNRRDPEAPVRVVEQERASKMTSGYRRHEILVFRCLVLSRMVGSDFKWNEHAADGMADRLSLFRQVLKG